MSKTILIADDDKQNLIYMELALKETGSKVLLADNGLMAFELFKNEKPDMVFADLYMPKMNGFQLLKEIRKLNKKIPVIAVTGADFDENDPEILEMEFTDFLRKPIDNKMVALVTAKYL